MLKRISGLLLVVLALIIVGCHTDSPEFVDVKNPTAQIDYVITGADTLYNHNQPENFVDFSNIISEDDEYDYDIEVFAEDNYKLFRYELIAVDVMTNNEHIISEKSTDATNVTFSINNESFPIVQLENIQQFYLKVKVYDEYENEGITDKKLGFMVGKALPTDKFSIKFGAIDEIDGLKQVDFADYTGKLVFVQFHGFICGSCIEETMHYNEFWTNHTNYDDYYIAVFGSQEPTMTPEYVRDTIKGQYGRALDCFFDDGQEYKKFFDELAGINGNNENFAITPDGILERFDHSAETFEEWVERMYSTHASK